MISIWWFTLFLGFIRISPKSSRPSFVHIPNPLCVIVKTDPLSGSGPLLSFKNVSPTDISLIFSPVFILTPTLLAIQNHSSLSLHSLPFKILPLFLSILLCSLSLNIYSASHFGSEYQQIASKYFPPPSLASSPTRLHVLRVHSQSHFISIFDD